MKYAVFYDNYLILSCRRKQVHIIFKFSSPRASLAKESYSHPPWPLPVLGPTNDVLSVVLSPSSSTPKCTFTPADLTLRPDVISTPGPNECMVGFFRRAGERDVHFFLLSFSVLTQLERRGPTQKKNVPPIKTVRTLHFGRHGRSSARWICDTIFLIYEKFNSIKTF